MIRAQGLVKDFSPGPLRAVDRLSFDVQAGEIYGLLGPNGAGKTTAMRLLSALLRPTAGTATVAGYSVIDQPGQVRERIGILTEVPGLYARLTPAEYLDFYAQMYGLDRAPSRAARIEELLRLVGLWDRRQSMMRTFSKGMQQRIAIARALVHDPLVLLFDEPTATLDPEAARSVRDYVRDLAVGRRRTVLLCTHNLPEADELCDRLSVIQRGQQIAEGTPAELRASTSTTCVLHVHQWTPALVGRLASLPAIESLNADGQGMIIYRTRDPWAVNPMVVREAVAAGADVVGLVEASATLEDAYLTLIKGAGA
jgi:ABC-2 type transport system ATP-binding protein